MPENFNLGLSSSDFGKLANEWNPATLDQGGQEAVAAAQQIHQQAVKGLADTGARMGARAQAQNAPTGFEKVVTRQTPEGPVTDAYGITPDQMAFFTKAADFYKQALGGYAQEAQRLEMMQQRAQSQPWQQLATALSANLAQQKDMPGWVQGLGATAAQMNPTVDQLAARKMAVMGQGAGIAERGMSIREVQRRTDLEAQALAERNAGQQRTLENQREDDFGKYLKEEANRAATLRTFDETSINRIVALAKQFGRTDERVATAVDSVRAAAEGGVQAYNDKQAEFDRQKKAESAQHLATAQAMIPIEAAKAKAVEAAKQSVADPLIDTVAKSLIAGNLASIRDITSFRGEQKLKLTNRLLELDPKFSIAELNRKIDMEKSFTVGKDGVGLQSFDTFLQHAGEVTDTLKNIQLTNSPLLNKSLNWWRKNMVGSPELATLETSLEPVRTEFMKFLLNQGALYLDDRKEMAKLVDANQPLKVTMAAMHQMGLTAKDRFSAANQRYKRVMKQDLQDPFSPEAHVGADKIGVELPRGTESTATGSKGETVNVTAEELKKLGFK
jgi:hypothetical protein